MDTNLGDYLDLLTKLHQDFNAALEGLSQEALDWVPGEEINSLTVLATHTAKSERYWIGDVAAGVTSDRHRPVEFLTKGVSAQDLIKGLEESLAFAKANLVDFSNAYLAEDCHSPIHDNAVTRGWALLHALEHTAQHTAHAGLTRQFWEMRLAEGD